MNNRQQTLLVLGGVAQVCDIVTDAKKKGIKVIVVDSLKNSPAKKYADESYDISITDINGIVKICNERKVTGIINYCIDPGQKPYQIICEKLGLPCYGTRVQFDILTNKDIFKKTCKENGLNIVTSYDINDSSNLSELKNCHFPLVIKPADGRASKGVTICNTLQEVPKAIELALSYSDRRKIICEEFVNGHEFAVKYFVIDGQIFLTSMSDIYTLYIKGIRIYIWSQIYPSKLFNKFIATTDQTVRKMIQQIGIMNGPLSFSGLYHSDEFCFIDPSFRMGGAQDWKIVTHNTGIDISNLLTDFALNGKINIPDKIENLDKGFTQKSSAILYFLCREGGIGAIEGIDESVKLKSVIGFHQMHSVGSVINQVGTSDHVVMRFLLVAKDTNTLKNEILRIQDLIKIRDIHGINMLLPNFDANLILS